MEIKQQVIGQYNNQDIIEYSLQNDHGISVYCLNYGAVLSRIYAPDKNGNAENIVLGFEQFDDYPAFSPYFGAIVGRVAGRIKEGQWKDHQLTKNEGSNHLHGGSQTFSHSVWKVEKIHQTTEQCEITFSFLSPDGDNGYPGNLKTYVTYTLTNSNDLKMKITGHCDKETLFNPTNHSYFNLSGGFKRTIAQHDLQIMSDFTAEVGADKCPTGKLLDADNSPLDFRKPKQLSDFFVEVPEGLDTPFLLTNPRINEKSIMLKEEMSGRKLTISTNRKAVVIFTSNGMNEEYKVDGGIPMTEHLGIAIETQELPDAVHHPDFGSIVLKPAETKEFETIYHFGIIQ